MNAQIAAAPARLGRPCTVCRHPNRAQIESELSSGEWSMRGIARRFGLAPENIRRHVRGHLADSVRAAMNEVAGTPALSIASRLLDVADSARDARLAAEEAGDDKLAAAMGAAEARTLASLVAMGVTTADIAAAIHDAEDVMRVFGVIARENPAVVDVMVDALERRNRPEWAGRIRQLSKTNLETNREAVSA